MSYDDWQIDYDGEFNIAKAVTFEERHKELLSNLSCVWSGVYKENSKAPTSLRRFTYGDFTFIFDDTGELIANGRVKEEDVPEGRVVAAFGISKAVIARRNRYRMQTYLGGTSKVYAHFGNYYDKGHFIANATGGPLEINLFPQKRDINRGLSSIGKEYRAMEKFVAAHPGTFVFSRPFYGDLTQRPIALEFGYLALSGEFVSACFPNI